jgi:hypothetical protein
MRNAHDLFVFGICVCTDCRLQLSHFHLSRFSERRIEPFVPRMSPPESKDSEGSAVDGLAPNDLISDVPQILSRSETSLLNALANLGAGDVVECYILTRAAQLEPLGSLGADTHNLFVRKSAIAFFYRPKGNTQDTAKRQLQLTLEYGPSRAGASLSYDTVPRVVTVNEDEKYVDWSNDGTWKDGSIHWLSFE